MRLTSATVYALEIPFVEAFKHSARDRRCCDSIVVRVRDEAGTEGFGEGVPRPYVTGETTEFVLERVARLWSETGGHELPDLDGRATLPAIEAWVPAADSGGLIADNASRAALETAILDCVLRRRGTPLGRLLPPCRTKVTYSGVITAGTLETALQQARRMKLIGIAQVKVKVGFDDDVARIRALREALGPRVSLRLDANGAWTIERALEILDSVASADIAAVEEPLGRGSLESLARLRREVSVPIMADESLVTVADAEALIAAQAVDYFNVRISKCGGLSRSLRIAGLAATAGIGVQVGSQVGETAILSAAGRHLAAHLEQIAFVEGSYGTLLLTEDVSADPVRFGHRGEAPLLSGAGLGARVLEDRLRKYARAVVELAPGASS
ncbi:MAG TPA: enolase C-terminal domain-like protein [Vicinamibacteria bacterium]|jgi:muconate cycloisomerase